MATRRIFSVIGVAATAMLIGAGAAQALPGGPWGSLEAKRGNVTVAAAYGTFQGYREDQGRGSRLQTFSAHREPSNTTLSGYRGAFVDTKWYANGDYCYWASFSLSAGKSSGGVGAGRTCAGGWHDSGPHGQSGRTHSKSWQYWEEWWQVDPKSNSGRAKIQTCEDIPSATDTCSAYILRGSSY